MSKKQVKEMPPPELREFFVEAAVRQGEATLSGDYKEGNEAFNLVNDAWYEMNDRGAACDLLSELLEHENVNVRLMAATRMLPIASKVAERVLKEISKGEGTIFPYHAKLILEQWEKGESYPFQST